MTYLAADTYNLIRSDPSKIIDIYAMVHDNFVSVANLQNASETIRKAAFCAIVASGMAPYGSDSYPNGYNFQTVLASPVLECSSYCDLSWWLFNQFGVSAEVHKVGWDGGYIGNHAQLIVKDTATGQTILLDPTVAVIAQGVTLAGLVSGVHYSTVANFFPELSPALTSFSATVQTALQNGLYQMRDGIYDRTGSPDNYSTGMTVGNSHSGFLTDDTFQWSGHSYGGKGNDTISGGSGNDTIEGGLGRDWLTGGAGSDVFYYHTALDSTMNSLQRDRIMDFQQGYDKINIHDIYNHGDVPVRHTSDLNGVVLTRLLWDTNQDGVLSGNDMCIDLVGNINIKPTDFIL